MIKKILPISWVPQRKSHLEKVLLEKVKWKRIIKSNSHWYFWQTIQFKSPLPKVFPQGQFWPNLNRQNVGENRLIFCSRHSMLKVKSNCRQRQKDIMKDHAHLIKINSYFIPKVKICIYLIKVDINMTNQITNCEKGHNFIEWMFI